MKDEEKKELNGIEESIKRLEQFRDEAETEEERKLFEKAIELKKKVNINY